MIICVFQLLMSTFFFLTFPYIIFIARNLLSNHTDYITQGIHILGTRSSFSLHRLDRTSFCLHGFEVFKYFQKRGYLNAFFLFLSIDKAYYSTFIILKTVVATIWICNHFFKKGIYAGFFQVGNAQSRDILILPTQSR